MCKRHCHHMCQHMGWYSRSQLFGPTCRLSSLNWRTPSPLIGEDALMSCVFSFLLANCHLVLFLFFIQMLSFNFVLIFAICFSHEWNVIYTTSSKQFIEFKRRRKGEILFSSLLEVMLVILCRLLRWYRCKYLGLSRTVED